MKEFGKNEPPTKPNNHRADIAHLQHHMGTLMAECALLQKRVEVAEAQIETLVSAQAKPQVSKSQPPHRYLELAKKTTLITASIIAGIILAIKELGFLFK